MWIKHPKNNRNNKRQAANKKEQKAMNYVLWPKISLWHGWPQHIVPQNGLSWNRNRADKYHKMTLPIDEI